MFPRTSALVRYQIHQQLQLAKAKEGNFEVYIKAFIIKEKKQQKLWIINLQGNTP